MPLNRHLKVDKASSDPSFMNKQTGQQAGECLLYVSSAQSRYQVTGWGISRGTSPSLPALRREQAGGMC